MTSAFSKSMQKSSILIQMACFSIGFWWMCHQAQIKPASIARSVVVGLLVGFAGLWTYVFFTHGNLMKGLSSLPVAILLGSGLVLWIQEHEKLAGKSSRDNAFMLTLSFLYFCSPLEASLRTIAVVMALPALGILLFCTFKNKFEEKEINILTAWTVILSMVMGIQQLGSSPEVLKPLEKTALVMSNVPYFFSIAMQAAGLISLALGIIPFVDWVQRAFSSKPDEPSAELKPDNFSLKRAVLLTLLHGLPMALNFKYKFCSYDAMLAYALAWSPVVSAHFASATDPEPKAKIIGWDDQDSSQAS